MMAIQLSTLVRNARLDSIETTIGTSAKVFLYSATDVVLSEIDLPTDWMNLASGGTKTKLGSWSGAGTVAAGTGTDIVRFELTDNTGSVVGISGTVTIAGDGGDMIVDNLNIAESQIINVIQFTLTDGNA